MAARLKELFGARGAGSNVFLNCYGLECRVFGATVPMSALPDESALTFTAHLPEGQDRGYIAVAVYHNWNGGKVWSGYIIELTRDEDGRVHANLDHPWVPEGQQIAQVNYLGIHVTDVVSGDRFTTHEGTAKHGVRYVPDGNLLVACVAGTKFVDEVRAAAQAVEAERSEIARLQALVEHLQELVRDRERIVGEKVIEIDGLKVTARTATEKRDDLETRIRCVSGSAGAEAYTAMEDLEREHKKLREIERRAIALRDSLPTGDYHWTPERDALTAALLSKP
ncbi:MAG: hypothetical protein Q7R80_03885 [bacterium]|nr:hypothetical protein [bacterium]